MLDKLVNSPAFLLLQVMLGFGWMLLMLTLLLVHLDGYYGLLLLFAVLYTRYAVTRYRQHLNRTNG